ncbi:MAG: YcjF family protein [Thainema sp.]
MQSFRYLPIAIAVFVIVILMIIAIGFLAGIYADIALISPLLARVLLVVLLLALAAAIAGLGYYGYLFLRPRRRRWRQPVPRNKAEAADATLQALQQQAEQIQDEVARQAMLQRSSQLAADFSQRDLRIVLFGAGSVGKTSIVNAIMGAFVGQVGAPMGTTQTEATYRLQLSGLRRDIQLVDTAGLFEAAIAGADRANQARELAISADLILFVVDNDLRQSEFVLLEQLATLGKRLLLVFNKMDLYPEAEQQQIIAQLQRRLSKLIAPQDVIAIAADPPIVSISQNEVFQPEPIIEPLLRRMSAVLRSEGEDLVADNLLLQSKQLGEQARQLIAQQRQQQADQVIDRYQWIGAGVVAVTPLPGVDLLATAAINAQMVVELGRIYGCEMDIERGRELALSLAKTLGSLGIVKGALQLLTVGLQTNVATLVVGRSIQGVTAAYLIRIAGKSFVEYFQRDQDWGDGGMSDVVQRQFQLNRRDELVKAFLQDAIARVVTPIAESLQRQPDSQPGSQTDLQQRGE